jgi:hypothetical protein
MVWVALILCEVERDAADEPPLRVSLAEIDLQPVRVLLDLRTNKRVER